MKRIVLTTWTLLLTTMSLWAEVVNVTSPDGKLSVNITCEQGRASYSVSYDGRPMLLPSALGLKTTIGDFQSGLTVNSVKREHVSKHYTMQGTKAAEVDYEANSLVVEYKNSNGHTLCVRFQVSNRDVAFRYEMARQKVGNKEMKRTVVVPSGRRKLLASPVTTVRFISLLPTFWRAIS